MTEKVEHTELPWSVWVEPIADADQAKKELGLLVEGTPDFRPHLVYLCGPNNLAPAVTGCGEKSIANAEYIVLACNSYPALLAERDRLREALRTAISHIDHMASFFGDQNMKLGLGYSFESLGEDIGDIRAPLKDSG